MKTCNSKIKAHAFLGAAFMLLIALIFTACPQKAKPKAKPEEPPPGPQKVTFSVEGTPANGELKAMAGSTEITSGKRVPYGTTVTFTATPLNTDYSVEKWTIKGGTLQAGGTEGSLTATVKITAETTVSVRFEHSYTEVPFGTNGANLADYLNTGSPASDGIYYIKITGLQAADLEGTAVASQLGKILKDKSPKKVSLKLPKTVEGLTDMRHCFHGCENLVSVAALPESVMNMNACFLGCTSLTQVSAIPQGVTQMIECFKGCTSLTKAPAIPASVTDMENCFAGCTSLTDAPAIPQGVTGMEGCFIKCTSLTKAPAIPAKVTLMRTCFQDCTSLTKAPAIPQGVTGMEGCFYGCTNLTEAPAIPESVKDMAQCFLGCTKLTQVPPIPKNTEFMTMCFQNCTSLTSVTLKCNYGDGKFRDAFKNCTSLSGGSIKVPHDYLQNYKDNANKMGTNPNNFSE